MYTIKKKYLKTILVIIIKIIIFKLVTLPLKTPPEISAEFNQCLVFRVIVCTEIVAINLDRSRCKLWIEREKRLWWRKDRFVVTISYSVRVVIKR